MNAIPAFTVVLWAIMAGASIAVVSLAVLAYRAATGRWRGAGIRPRLTWMATLLVIAVAVAVGATSVFVGVRLSRQRAYDQLQTAVLLKQQAIDQWVSQLTFALGSLVVEDYEVQRAQSVILGNLPVDFRATAQLELRTRFNSVIKRTRWFEEISLVTTDGVVALSTDVDHEGRNVENAPYFAEALVDVYVTPPYYDPVAGGAAVVFARPLKLGNTVYGILAARSNMDELTQITQPAQADPSSAGTEASSGSATYLVGRDYILLTAPVLAGGYLPVHSPAINAAVGEHASLGRQAYTNHRGVPVLGVYTWVPSLDAGLVEELTTAEVLAGARQTSVATIVIAVLAALAATMAALAFSRGITRPLTELAATATRIAEGDLSLKARIAGDDEVGAVAGAFNAMTDQLRDLIGDLERRVEERTRGLQAVTEVSRATTSLLDPALLLPEIVTMVRQRFGLYYVGLFLWEETEQQAYAVLRAGTGEAGARMLEEGWRLAVGGESMIGQCLATGEPIIQQREGEVAVRLANPWLPETRSELALPLRYGDRIIGAMTVQSTEDAAFAESDLAVLQNLADQVAVAVQNAQLFAETQAALDRAHRLQRRYQTQAWSDYLGRLDITGYELYREDGDGPGRERLTSLADEVLPEVRDGAGSDLPVVQGSQLRIPLIQGGQVVGVMGIERASAWQEDEIDLVQGLVEQLTLTAENQRLLDDVTQRAAMERTIGEITSRVRAEIEVESVLERALGELAQALGAERGAAQLSLNGSSEAGSDGRENGS